MIVLNKTELAVWGNNSDGPPTGLEILNGLKKLKNHKSAGIDEISNEQLKYGASGLVDRMEKLFSKVWNSEAVPDDWLKGIVIIFPKKGDTIYLPLLQ